MNWLILFKVIIECIIEELVKYLNLLLMMIGIGFGIYNDVM